MLEAFKTPKKIWLATALLCVSQYAYSDASPQGLENSGGLLTTAATGDLSFTLPYLELTAKLGKQFIEGHEQFNELWVLAPAPGIWGLGPTFNEANCAGCHPNNSRARPAADGATVEKGNVIKLGYRQIDGVVFPSHPWYGDQLQNRAAENRVPIEGEAIVTYEASIFEYPDKTTVALKRPLIEIRNLNFGEINDATLASMRIAPQVIGLGLLEWVPDASLLNIVAEQKEGGLSGRPNYVIDLETEDVVIGRFGWKASQPNLKQQTASAFHSDIGATTFFFPEKNCPEVQTKCRELPSAAKCGGQGGCTGNTFRPEVLPSRLSNITTYLQALNIPQRRINDQEKTLAGETLFSQVGCAGCHVPTLKTGSKGPIKELRNMSFHPYTDLLIHDMGEKLADHRPEGSADGQEWRTPPLWGIGLLSAISGHLGLLHDGRAQSVEEAILWHGGEAEKTRKRFTNLTKSERESVIEFINSL